MTVTSFARPSRGLRLLVGMNRDRLLYAATIVLALWLGAAAGKFLLG